MILAVKSGIDLYYALTINRFSMPTVLGRPSTNKKQEDTVTNEAEKSVMVKLQEVTKTYANGSRGLYGVNLEVKRGDFLLITGPSGAGKSTLLKLLYGAERASSGEVMVAQYDVGKLRGDRLSLLRRRIGIVFQDYKLIPSRTVTENI
ncbi:MAG: ATP-binding cassette domain-containing protein, partial [Coleofasciculaceae cyanobacterium]